MIGVLNYNAGNLKSVVSALNFIDATYFVSSKPEELLKADKLIFPGVGDAKFAMNMLSQTGNAEMLKEFVKTGKPLLGICLGAQILFSHSQERDTLCLDLIPGNVVKFDFNSDIFNGEQNLKIPHMGWNHVDVMQSDSLLFRGIPNNTSFYFVHSYYIKPENQGVVAGSTVYGIPFCAAIEYQNIVAAQFHPEKSGKYGLQMLSNFIRSGGA